MASCGSESDRADVAPPATTAVAATVADPEPTRPETTRTDATETETTDAGVTGEVMHEYLAVPAPSLANNLLGDPAELQVAIQLPASYGAGDARYPVVYFLDGFEESASVVPIGTALQDLVLEGQAPEMIVVAVTGTNSFGGGFYVDSPVTGNWAQAIWVDLVAAIDASYRTIAERDSRGIAGFSMGGYGALDLAMRHPDVFGAVYALGPGLFDETGLADSQMFADPATVGYFIDGQSELAAMPTDEALASMRSAMGPTADVMFSLAYGMAFAPDVTVGPPFVDYPYTEVGGPRDESAWQRWEAGYGGIAAEVAEYADNLRSLRGIVVDYGTRDEYTWIPRGCEYFAAQLEQAGIPMRLEHFEGGHGSVAVRAGEVMWPLFADVLSTT